MNAIGRVTKALENISELDNETLPRRYLESIVRILTTICLDNNQQMQVAQRAIGTMSEVIEDLMGNEEKAKEVKKENKRLSKVIEQLRKDLKRASDMFDNMMEFTKPE